MLIKREKGRWFNGVYNTSVLGRIVLVDDHN